MADEAGGGAGAMDRYGARARMGPAYRADMWVLLDGEPGLTPAELARRTYGSFATGWQFKRDCELIQGIGPAATARGERAA